MIMQFQKLAEELLINISFYINITYVGAIICFQSLSTIAEFVSRSATANSATKLSADEFNHGRGALFPGSRYCNNGWFIQLWPEPVKASLASCTQGWNSNGCPYLNTNRHWVPVWGLNEINVQCRRGEI